MIGKESEGVKAELLVFGANCLFCGVEHNCQFWELVAVTINPPLGAHTHYIHTRTHSLPRLLYSFLSASLPLFPRSLSGALLILKPLGSNPVTYPVPALLSLKTSISVACFSVSSPYTINLLDRFEGCPFSSSEILKEKMTQQNVVVSDPKSGINMAITVAVSNSSIFTTSVQKPPAAQGGYISISRKKFLKNLEINGLGGARINAWVDSMRASSPTHVKSNSTPSLADDHHSSWIVRHPSALDMFEEIIDASKGKQIVMFLDYDGTLSPIVEDPDRAFMSDAMRKTVRKLARCFPTAIVSGRCRDKVYNFVRLAELYYAGSHGMDIKGPTTSSKYNQDSEAILFQPATEFLPMIDEVYQQLVEKTKSTPGAIVENNRFCVSVHFRCVDEKKWSELAHQVRSVLKGYPKLRLNQGRKVLEIRPIIKWDKGNALEFLLDSLGFANCTDVFPVYIGDDRTDEDAFKKLRDRGQGFGILVSKFPKDTCASYTLQEPDEVMDFLQRLVDWKRLSLRAHSRV
ncbi:hypothetical protein L6164_025136 [Bauhinia variegata]|uniref:Uncharacterized protein n=1 Tax=Bauhinia variegata TaxID=167791 RepID=A0ACB9LZN3_BAUVA|nr:hypothetical protein L6164_025136 [Bauhinia variegata]